MSAPNRQARDQGLFYDPNTGQYYRIDPATKRRIYVNAPTKSFPKPQSDETPRKGPFLEANILPRPAPGVPGDPKLRNYSVVPGSSNVKPFPSFQPGVAANSQGYSAPTSDASIRDITRRVQMAALESLPERSELDPAYRVHPKPQKFFGFGRVFLTLWTEPQGQPTGRRSSFVSRNKDVYRVAYKEKAHSKVRRFIVIRPGDQSCTCLAISTHSGLGATQRNPLEHGIVFTSGAIPPRLQSEAQMQPIAIRIDVDQPGSALDSMSRVHYGKTYTIEHNFKVKPFGMVNRESVQALVNQFRSVFLSRIDDHPQGMRTIREGQALGGAADASNKGKSREVGLATTNQYLNRDHRDAMARHAPATSVINAPASQRRPSMSELKAMGFDDSQIRRIIALITSNHNPRYAMARVQAEGPPEHLSGELAHEVGRLVVVGIPYTEAIAKVKRRKSGEAQDNDGPNQSDSDDGEDQSDEEEEENDEREDDEQEEGDDEEDEEEDEEEAEDDDDDDDDGEEEEGEDDENGTAENGTDEEDDG